jgi:hypothetical protein
VDKRGWNLLDRLTLPLHPSFLTFVSFSLALCLLFNLCPLPTVMVSDLPPSYYQTESDLRKLRKVIGWQYSAYDLKMRHGLVSLANMQPGDFVVFSLYALSGLMPPLSSFFFMLLEHYGLQLPHLSPHSITMVSMFVHFCQMFVGVRPSVCLFRRFHVLHATRKHPPRFGGYYF